MAYSWTKKLATSQRLEDVSQAPAPEAREAQAPGGGNVR